MILFFRSAGVWLCLLVIAFMNGAFREFVLKGALSMDARSANQRSCLTGILFMTGFVFLVWAKLRVFTLQQALKVGAGWLIATALFEAFILNRNLTWAEILHTYDVSSGELWGIVLLWIWVLPIFVRSLKEDVSPHNP